MVYSSATANHEELEAQMQDTAEYYGLAEITHFVSVMRSLNAGEQEFSAFSGFPKNGESEVCFVENNIWEKLENGLLALDFARSYQRKNMSKPEFLKVVKAIRSSDFCTLNKILPHKSVVRYKAQKGDK